MGYKEFIRRVVRYERSKIVLPVLMLVVLISAIGLGGHLRAENVDREVVENSQHTVENLTIIFAEHEFFNGSVEMSQRERGQRISERMQQETRQIMNLPSVKAEVYLLGFIYKSDLYPLLPSAIPGQDGNSILFSKNKGYYLTDTTPKTLTEISYFNYRMEKLNRKINDSRENWTLARYRNKVKEVESIEYPDDRIITYLKDSNATSFRGSISTGEVANTEGALKPVIQEEIKEVKYYHFLPTAIVTFLLYYLLSGLFVETFRMVKSKI